MDKLFEIHKINNGYITVAFDPVTKMKTYRSFQWNDTNNQMKQMFEYTIKVIGEKNLRVVTEKEFIKTLQVIK